MFSGEEDKQQHLRINKSLSKAGATLKLIKHTFGLFIKTNL